MSDTIPEDEKFLKLLKAAGKARPNKKDIPLPGYETILSVFAGEATDVQMREFEQALLDSPTFRSQVMELQKDISTFEQRRPQPDTPIVVPTYESLGISADAPRTALSGRMVPDSHFRPSSISDWIRKWRQTLIAVPTTAAVAVAASYLLFFTATSSIHRPGSQAQESSELKAPSGESMLLAQSEVPGSLLLEPEGTRGSSDEAPLTRAVDSAAISSFRSLLEESDLTGTFRLKPAEELPKRDSFLHEVWIFVQLGDSSETNPFVIPVPVSSAMLQSAQLWALTLPSLSLFTMPVKGDTVRIVWPSGSEFDACLAITWRENDLAQASAVQFSVPKKAN